MKTSKQCAINFFISLIFISSPLCSAEAGAFYVGAELGTVRVSAKGPNNDPAFVAHQTFNDSDSVYGLRAGFQFNSWFAAELGFTDFGRTTDRFKFKDGIVFLVQPNDTQTVDAKGVSLSGVFNYALSPRVSFLGILGVSAVDYEMNISGGFSPFVGNLAQNDNFSDQGLVFGLGAKYAVNDSIAVRADMRRNEVGDFTLDVLGVGFEYSF